MTTYGDGKHLGVKFQEVPISLSTHNVIILQSTLIKKYGNTVKILRIMLPFPFFTFIMEYGAGQRSAL